MKEAPHITVLMPAYNAAEFLREAIDSVLAQTLREFEFLIIDDGSTDHTAAIIGSYTDPRIRLIQQERNKGLVNTLNAGIREARGLYIARMDADDIMHPDRLLEQYNYLEEHTEIAVVGSYVEFINVESAVTGSWGTDRSATTEAEIRDMMPRTNCLAHPSVMMRTGIAQELGYSGKHEDWSLWLRMLSRGHRITKLPKPLLEYRVHSSSYMGAMKQTTSLEKRLLQSRCGILKSEWRKLHFSTFQIRIMYAQMRTLARYFINTIALPFMRGAKRLFTYSPVALLRERNQLVRTLAAWEGRHLFTFSYLNTGGAEQVHAEIVSTVRNEDPLIIFTGFSANTGSKKQFAAVGKVLEIPRILHHPFTSTWARNRIVEALNSKATPVLFGANTEHFFHWLPFLKHGTHAIQLIHAFLYQPNGNRKHRSWLWLYDRIEKYVFISQQAKNEFALLLRAEHIPSREYNKLMFISNAVDHFGSVAVHQKIGLLFVGRNSPEKRIHLFLELADRLHGSHPGQFRFTVVGVEKMNGHSHIDFKGLVTEKAEMNVIYAAHEILVVTSDREGFPLVIMEAMAHGLVVLSTPVGDVPNRLDPSFACITSTVASSVVVNELYDLSISFLTDRERLSEMRSRSIAIAKADFDMDHFRRSYSALLTGSTS